MMFLATVFLWLLGVSSIDGFPGATRQQPSATKQRHVARRPGSCQRALDALSERQMQFWEDVEDGLDDIESFYAKKSLSIDRIRQFGKRCVALSDVQ